MSKQKAARGGAYTAGENAVVVAAYVRLVVAQRAGEKVNKAALVREVLAQCPGRSRGSIEAKFMNLSAFAVRDGLLPDLPGGYVQGYKPAPNGQAVLAEMLRAELAALD